jgi:hypothetical protein
MQRLEQLKLAKQLMLVQQQQAAQALVEAESCSVLDVRQWLLAGLLASLKKDAAAVVARARYGAVQVQHYTSSQATCCLAIGILWSACYCQSCGKHEQTVITGIQLHTRHVYLLLAAIAWFPQQHRRL